MNIYNYIPGDEISHPILPSTRIVSRELVVEDLGPLDPTTYTNSDLYKQSLLQEETIKYNSRTQSILQDWYVVQSEISSLYAEYNELATQVTNDDISNTLLDAELRMNVICQDLSTGLLPDLIRDRDELEGSNPWLSELRVVDGDLSKIPEIVYIEELSDELANKVIRHERNITSRDLETTVGDVAKMSSLIFSMVSTIYKAMPDAQKEKIPLAERAIIDHALESKAKTTTRADKQLEVFGLKAVTKLFDREREITEIIAKHKTDVPPPEPEPELDADGNPVPEAIDSEVPEINDSTVSEANDSETPEAIDDAVSDSTDNTTPNANDN